MTVQMTEKFKKINRPMPATICHGQPIATSGPEHIYTNIRILPKIKPFVVSFTSMLYFIAIFQFLEISGIERIEFNQFVYFGYL